MVLFEVVDSDRPPRDSMLSYSDSWAKVHIKDFPTSQSDDHVDGASATSSPTSAFRPKPPSLKILIPDTGERLGDKRPKVVGNVPAAAPHRKAALTPEKAEKLAAEVSIPRADLPTPVIFLQPPTPPQAVENTLVPEKLHIEDPPAAEATKIVQSPSTEDTPKSPNSLSLPPSPSLDDPVALPAQPTDVKMNSPVQIQARRGTFLFKIPPAKNDKTAKNKNIVKRQKLDKRTRGNDDDTSSLTDESMSIDRSLSLDAANGYDLALMFDSPSRENPHGGLPEHLKPKGNDSKQTHPSNETRRLYRTIYPNQEIVGTIKTMPRTPLDSKNALERHVRPALVKLFGGYFLVMGIPN